MAIVANGFAVTLKLAETSGQITERHFFAGPDITDLDELAAAWAIALPKVMAMTDCVNAGYDYKVLFVNDALALPAAAEINNQGLFTGKIIGNPFKSATTSIPAIKPALTVSPTGRGFDVVDMADAAVIAYVNMFDSGEAAGDWLISDGESWTNDTVFGRRRNTRSSHS